MAILTNATTYQTTPTHDGSGQVVHPSVVDFKIEYGLDNWCGYRYWMAITPYPNSDDAQEDPNILASNDGKTWIVPSGIKNPLDDKPGSYYSEPDDYNNDTELIYDSDNNCLIVIWREYIRGVNDLIYRIVINAGSPVTVNSKELLFANNFSDGHGTDLSPTVWRKSATEWYMWSCNGEDVFLRTSSDGLNWSGRATTNNPWRTWTKAFYKAWHIEAKPNYRENRIEFLICGFLDNGQTYTSMNLFYAQCPMDKPTVFSMPLNDFVIQISSSGWDNKFIYRTAFVIEEKNNNYFYHVWYSARNYSGTWHLGYTEGELGTSYSLSPPAPPPLTPIDFIKVDTPNGIQIIPVYALSDIINNSLRIYINRQIGCFELVDAANVNASEVRIYKDGVIKCLST